MEPPPQPPEGWDDRWRVQKKNPMKNFFLVAVLAFAIAIPAASLFMNQEQTYDTRSRAATEDPHCPTGKKYICFRDNPDTRTLCKKEGKWNAYVCGNTADNCTVTDDCQ